MSASSPLSMACSPSSRPRDLNCRWQGYSTVLWPLGPLALMPLLPAKTGPDDAAVVIPSEVLKPASCRPIFCGMAAPATLKLLTHGTAASAAGQRRTHSRATRISAVRRRVFPHRLTAVHPPWRGGSPSYAPVVRTEPPGVMLLAAVPRPKPRRDRIPSPSAAPSSTGNQLPAWNSHISSPPPVPLSFPPLVLAQFFVGGEGRRRE